MCSCCRLVNPGLGASRKENIDDDDQTIQLVSTRACRHAASWPLVLVATHHSMARDRAKWSGSGRRPNRTLLGHVVSRRRRRYQSIRDASQHRPLLSFIDIPSLHTYRHRHRWLDLNSFVGKNMFTKSEVETFEWGTQNTRSETSDDSGRKNV